jgi:hypothetical protein
MTGIVRKGDRQMNRKPILAGLLSCAFLLGAAAPALANGWTYTGPHGATVHHWGPAPYPYHPYPYHPCCGYGAGAVAAGAVAGLATGLAIGAATHPVPPPVYVAPAPVVVAPAPVVVVPPPRPVYVAPGAYYYVP